MYLALHALLNSKEFYDTKSSLSLIPSVSSQTSSNPSNPTWHYYMNGAIAGMTGILLSHPVDTAKTHIQTGQLLRDFKPQLKNLYRGLAAPLVGVGLEKAIVFGTYNWALANCSDNIAFAGALAGLNAALIVTPYERIKILRQNRVGFNKQEITMEFLFRGLSTTWTREIPGFAIYFTVYENLKYHLHTQHQREIGYANSFVYGGLSGITAWIFIYPQDRIKTILQATRRSNEKGNNTGFKSVMLDIYRAGGLRHFYTGFSWAVARAMLLHSGTFCMMEFMNKKI